MEINGYKIKYSEEDLKDKVTKQMRQIVLADEKCESYAALSDGDKKAFKHLAKAADILNDVALESDHPLNLAMKKALEEAAKDSSYAADALKLFNSLGGVAGSNGLDKEPVEIFEGIKAYDGRNFYPSDLTADELRKIITAMLDAGRTEEVKNILSARTMVRRDGEYLKATDYTEYFKTYFTKAAKELREAAELTTDKLFKKYLEKQAEALSKNDENADIEADKYWAEMQDTPLEFTLSRENYEDRLTPTIFADKELCKRLNELGIRPVPKDTLGVRAGFVNKEGTELLLKFKDEMIKLASLMPYCDKYTQSVGETAGLKQTMVDVDVAKLTGDYAQCRGGITTAQNLPNNDKPSLAHGGGRRNVYHRQVRQSTDKEKTAKILEGLVSPELHKYYNEDSDHLFVIGHENGHSLGPDSSFQTALGIYQHIIEEHKADVISAAMLPEYVKAGIIDEETLKSVYTTWIVRRLFMTAAPTDGEAHRVADAMEYKYLHNHGAFHFDENKKLKINFAKMPRICRRLLADIIRVQLSKSPKVAERFIKKWSSWGAMQQYVADFKKNLGVRPYIEIVSSF